MAFWGLGTAIASWQGVLLYSLFTFASRRDDFVQFCFSLSQGGCMRSKNSRGMVLLSGLALFLSLGLSAFAQSDNAQISGFVKDPSGAVVPGVTVVAKNEARVF